jgi:flagellin
MSSILTNNGAMVALQTLKNTNANMQNVQNQIATGKSVSSAKDNAATWAISKVMEADVTGFKAISDSLSLGESTVAVARNATETVTDLLKEIKGKISSAQEANVDRGKIQTDIAALRDQITSVTSAAQFNGLNLIDGNAESPVKVMASLDRAADGTVTAKHIDVEAQDLSQKAQVIASDAVYAAGTTGTLNGTQTADITVAAPTAGVAYSIGMTGTDANADKFTPADYTTSGDVAGASKIVYVAKEGDTAADVATGLAAAYAQYAADEGLDTDILNVAANGDKLTFTSTVTDATDTIGVRVSTLTSASDGNVAAGGLAALTDIDVSTEEGAQAALASIEGLLQTSIDAAAAFGSVEKRISIQNDFVGKLTDSMKSGIGSLVDADMEETSARLQALQVQQQLGVQALSMANQAPQSVLSLFR